MILPVLVSVIFATGVAASEVSAHDRADAGEVFLDGLHVDDECKVGHGGAEDCALAALQLHGKSVLAQQAHQQPSTVAAAAAAAPAAKGTSEQLPAVTGWSNLKDPEDPPQSQPVFEAKEQAVDEKKQPGVALNPGISLDPGTGYTGFQPVRAAGTQYHEWHGGGLVDSLPGNEQVDLMAIRDEDWKMGRIVYQVFVDRFVPPENLTKAKEYLKPPRKVLEWSDPVKGGPQDAETKYYSSELDFYGGDLQGLLSKLDYVRSWGDILYLQPIFKAYSVHKYDTSDYHQIDPGYGTIEDFDELVVAVHAMGMHLVLDGVFNHCGVRNDVFLEALHNPLSPHRGWFFIGEQYGPTGYKNWQNGGTLAEFRLEDESLQDYIWGRTDSVVATWLKRGADGWRLDVATEIGREFLWDLTYSAHRHKYGSLVVGEISAYPRWWTESMDGILSFWLGWIIEGVANNDLKGNIAAKEIAILIKQSSMEQLLRSWIVVSNHDLPRMMNKYPDPVKRELARTLQFVLPGSPCIYYGEEIGMEGKGDPENRAPMQWDMVSDDNPIMNHTRFLVDLRRRKRALRIGDFHALLAFNLFAFLRRTDRIDELVVVATNQGPYAVVEQLSLNVEDVLEYTPFRDVMSGEILRVHGGTLVVSVPPQTCRIFEMAKESGPASDQYKRIYGHWATFPDVDAGHSVGKSQRWG